MFDGTNFFEVALNLRANGEGTPTSEAFFRSAIGRAYYACFHAFRARYFAKEKWNVPKERGEKEYVSHRKLRLKVRELGSNVTADKLDTLVELREHADYHSWVPTPEGAPALPPACYCAWSPDPRNNCDLAVQLAENLLREVEGRTGSP